MKTYIWLLKKIKTRVKKNSKISISIRTILTKSFFSRLQSNIINEFSDKKLFISKINKSKFNELVKIKKKNNYVLENFTFNKKVTNNFLLKKSKKKKLI